MFPQHLAVGVRWRESMTRGLNLLTEGGVAWEGSYHVAAQNVYRGVFGPQERDLRDRDHANRGVPDVPDHAVPGVPRLS